MSAIDRSRLPGQRVSNIALNGQPIDPARKYRVTVNSFLSSGGDGFSTFAAMPVVADGGLDLDALEAFIKDGVEIPRPGRVVEIGGDSAR